MGWRERIGKTRTTWADDEPGVARRDADRGPETARPDRPPPADEPLASLLSTRRARMLVLAGGVLVAVGALLPWISIVSGFGSIGVNGIEGDGIFALIIGGVITLYAFLTLDQPERGRALLILGSIAALGLYAFEWNSVQTRLTGREPSEFVRASVGIGIYVGLAGGLAAIIGSVAGRDSRPS